ncbi:hypothetical protein A5893_04480 [Pedobacter psychrophilus]|uniref:Carbohydrate-binding protein SusD n=1 Tax=Pedobacter psychrophilus TaxID=1826909 RepID=A0A179DNL5_9SPHI|nr:RagB/SusD family nutrient uptake outer membrane protein [Pedobacter psychrophilus]OAQ42372.1 hypothetical protein A5893_04480 [Pedobacter psychrophilus]
MRNQYKKLPIILLFILLIFTSCEKLLDKEPTDKLSLEDVFKDTQGAKTALAGAYKSLLTINVYNRNVMVYPDLMGGNIKYSKTANFILDDIYNLIQNQNDCTMNDTYSDLYKQLNNVNNIIAYTPTAAGPEKDKNRMIAEAKCIRALIHFEILRIYARPFGYTPDASHVGIVINLKPQLFGDPAPVRSTVAQCYTAIKNDINEAILLFDNSNVVFPNGYQQNYFSKLNAKAFLSKIDLYSNNFSEAFQLADEVIKEGTYKLLTNAQYVGSWAGRIPSSESIIELPVENDFSSSSLGSYYQISLTPDGMYAATNDILNLYSSTDIRGRNNMFIANTINSTVFYSTKKYEKGSINATPIKLLRLSEIYLIRAEAAAELNRYDVANNDLNIIRKRADSNATDLNLTVKSDLINAVLLERRKELAFEGNLFFDLVRRNQGINRNDCTSPNCSLAFSDYRLVMPLPAQTINANTAIKQNEGY